MNEDRGGLIDLPFNNQRINQHIQRNEVNRLIATVGVGAVLFGGTACGSAETPAVAVTVTAAPSPAPTVTATPAPAPTVTITSTPSVTPEEVPDDAASTNGMGQWESLENEWSALDVSEWDERCDMWINDPAKMLAEYDFPGWKDSKTIGFFDYSCL